MFPATFFFESTANLFCEPMIYPGTNLYCNSKTLAYKICLVYYIVFNIDQKLSRKTDPWCDFPWPWTLTDFSKTLGEILFFIWYRRGWIKRNGYHFRVQIVLYAWIIVEITWPCEPIRSNCMVDKDFFKDFFSHIKQFLFRPLKCVLLAMTKAIVYDS